MDGGAHECRLLKSGVNDHERPQTRPSEAKQGQTSADKCGRAQPSAGAIKHTLAGACGGNEGSGNSSSIGDSENSNSGNGKEMENKVYTNGKDHERGDGCM